MADIRLGDVTLQYHKTLPFSGDVLIRRVPFQQDDIGKTLAIGQRVSGHMAFHPIALPWEPDGYPLSLDLFFRGIAAEGEMRGGLKATGHEALSWRHDHRQKLRREIQRHFSSPADGILMALVLGDKTAVPLNMRAAFATSGLAHLLAISGLHMTLVAAFLFFLVRRICVFFPRYAGIYDSKRPAAIITLFGLSYYLFLCFESISARRAFLMTCVFLLSIFMGRAALSVKNLILSGIIILCVWPESLMMPGFQMSFSAVFGFLLIYKIPQVEGWFSAVVKRGWISQSLLFIGGVVMTTAIASVATLPMTLGMFHQVPVYTLLANIVAIPLMNFLIMPLVVLSMPFWALSEGGLLTLPLQEAIGLLGNWAGWISDLEGAVFAKPPVPHWALWVCGLSAAGLVYGQLKGLYYVPLYLLGCVGLFSGTSAHIFFAPQAPYMGIAIKDKLLLPLGRSGFPVLCWQQRTGGSGIIFVPPDSDTLGDEPPPFRVLTDGEGVLITTEACSVLFLNDPKVHTVTASHHATFVLGRRRIINGSDHALSLMDLRILGALEVRFSGSRLQITSSALKMGQRPWNPYGKEIGTYEKKLAALL